MAYLYRHIRLDKNEPFYIGIGSDSNYKRAYSERGRNVFWKRIVNKIEYRVDIIFDNLSWELICRKEIRLIKLYGRRDLKLGTLCNLTDGGDGSLGVIPSIITREKMIKALKNRKISENTRLKLSISKLGINNPMYHKEITNEHRNNLKLARVGKFPTIPKKIINTVTNQVFNSAREASDFYNLTLTAFYKRLNRNSKSIPLKYI